jgi:SOS-response transcriptional repressor LexA
MEENFGGRLQRLIDMAGLNQSELARKMKVSPTYINQLVQGTRYPGRETLKKLSKALNISIDMLMGESRISPATIPRHKIPLISWMSAGQWHEAVNIYQPGYAEDWVSYDIKDTHAFALRVEDDSMDPEYRQGDIIIASPSRKANKGDDVIARYDDVVTFKRLKKLSKALVLLTPLNSVYEDIIIQGKALKKFRIIGPVVGLIRMIR